MLLLCNHSLSKSYRYSINFNVSEINSTLLQSCYYILTWEDSSFSLANCSFSLGQVFEKLCSLQASESAYLNDSHARIFKEARKWLLEDLQSFQISLPLQW